MKNRKALSALSSSLLAFAILVQSVLLHTTRGLVFALAALGLVFALAALVAGWLAPPPIDVEAQIADLRLQGVWPPDGLGTDADVKNVLKAGHKLLAIGLYSEIHQVPIKRLRRLNSSTESIIFSQAARQGAGSSRLQLRSPRVSITISRFI